MIPEGGRRLARFSRRKRIAAGVASAFLLLLVVAYLARAAILTAMAEFLTVEDPVASADVIYVLGGEAYVRPAKAAELYKAGLAPRIVIPQPEDSPSHDLLVVPNVTDVAVVLLQKLGVPDSAIVVLRIPGGSTSTVQDARLFRDYVTRNDVRRAIVVTSMFHSRRTRWAIRKALGDMAVEVMMAPADDSRFNERNWWTVEAGILAYVEEYLKWIHNVSHW
ncbi:MAG: YdcF family protein [Longimicrobiales bacterium]